jgi:hypothetical protein
VGKKWYSFFVVTDDPGRTTDPTAVPDLSATAAPAVAAAPHRVRDLVPDAGTETTFAEPVTSAVDLGEVYGSAQIPVPAHGYTVLKVAEMLRSEHIRELPPEVRRKSVMVALDAAGVKVTDVVEDAVRRGLGESGDLSLPIGGAAPWNGGVATRAAGATGEQSA